MLCVWIGVQMDLDYFTTLEGVIIADSLPIGWYTPEEY